MKKDFFDRFRKKFFFQHALARDFVDAKSVIKTCFLLDEEEKNVNNIIKLTVRFSRTKKANLAWVRFPPRAFLSRMNFMK